MAMDGAAQEVLEKLNSCCVGGGLFVTVPDE